MQNDEFAEAEAALAAMMQAEAEVEANASASAEAEMETAEAEALYQQALEAERLAPTTDEGENDINITPVFNQDALIQRLDDLNQNYVIGSDPISDTNTPSNMDVTFIATNTNNTIEYVNPGLLHQIEQVDVEQTTGSTLTNEDITQAIENIINAPVQPPSFIPEIKTEKVDSSVYNEKGFLTIAEIKMELMPILEDLYPNKWDWDDKNRIVIHFPEFTIINSKNEQHIIKDMYVRLKYNHASKRFNGSYSGARFTVTKSELIGAYAHSHLPSINHETVGVYQSFCLGTSTLSYLLSDLATFDMVKAKLENIKLKFTLVLMEIDNYLQWESLEGGPYRKISNIGSGRLHSIDRNYIFNTSKTIMENVWLEIHHNNYKPQFKFNNNGLLILIKNDEFISKISTYCKGEHLVFRDAAGKFFSEKAGSKRIIGTLNNKEIIFKGKTITTQLIEDNKIYEESGKEFAHPEIVTRCKHTIEKAINTIWKAELASKITTHYSKRKRKIKNSSQNLFTNLTYVWNSIES